MSPAVLRAHHLKVIDEGKVACTSINDYTRHARTVPKTAALSLAAPLLMV